MVNLKGRKGRCSSVRNKQEIESEPKESRCVKPMRMKPSSWVQALGSEVLNSHVEIEDDALGVYV